PVLVDFWADWCMPCRTMGPVVEALSKKYVGKVVFAKLNVDENPKIASQYGISAIPNFILFAKGQSIDQVLGAVGENGLEDMLKRKLQA
ncbi:MAG: thioredoxin, partial [Candidatus Bathyarchaeota archaeon]